MYRCEDCRIKFETPIEVDDSFDHAFGWEKRTLLACPNCRSDRIETVVRCGNPRDNIGFMRPDDIICEDCRRELKKAVIGFFDRMTYEEEQQFDAWMDGTSIQDRKEWKTDDD